MTSMGVNQKGPTDQDLIRRRRRDYDLAWFAAWKLLSDDRRFLGAQRFKRLICDVAALRALGSSTTLLKEITIATHNGDPAGIAMLNEGYANACAAAKSAIDSSDTKV